MKEKEFKDFEETSDLGLCPPFLTSYKLFALQTCQRGGFFKSLLGNNVQSVGFNLLIFHPDLFFSSPTLLAGVKQNLDTAISAQLNDIEKE